MGGWLGIGVGVTGGRRLALVLWERRMLPHKFSPSSTELDGSLSFAVVTNYDKNGIRCDLVYRSEAEMNICPSALPHDRKLCCAPLHMCAHAHKQMERERTAHVLTHEERGRNERTVGEGGQHTLVICTPG